MRELTNLRPVSQLRLLPRIAEAVITNQLQFHLENNTILHDLQSGFRPGRGTELAVAEVREQLLWCADRSHPAILILLDLSAAFDTVDHKILIKRLEEVAGVKGRALEWFDSFLDKRSQAVKWGDFRSEDKNLPCGVPQGSSLSPILFNVYLRPLASLLECTGLQFQMYADDTQILVDLHEEAGQKERLVPSLILIKDWMRVNKLCLNDNKTEILAVEGQRGQGLPDIPWPPSWGSLPTPVLQTRDLGIRISHHLDGAAHAAATVSASHHHLNSLARLFPLLNLKQKKQMYQAFVGSRISYGLSSMLSATKKTLHSLQKIQNRAVRMIFNLNRRDHISPWRTLLGWLTVEGQLMFKICLWIWKASRQCGPGYIHKWTKFPPSRQGRRTIHDRLLHLPMVKKSTKGGTTIARKGSSFWNTLPQQLRSLQSFTMFKAQLKTFLLNGERVGATSATEHQGLTPSIQQPRAQQANPSQAQESFILSQWDKPGPERRVPSTELTGRQPPLITGLSSPPLRGPINWGLVEIAKRNKARNLGPDGQYRPRTILTG